MIAQTQTHPAVCRRGLHASQPATAMAAQVANSPAALAAKAFDLNLKNASGNASSPFFAWTKKNCLPASPTYFWSDVSWDSLNGL